VIVEDVRLCSRQRKHTRKSQFDCAPEIASCTFDIVVQTKGIDPYPIERLQGSAKHLNTPPHSHEPDQRHHMLMQVHRVEQEYILKD
jgi:hypothetical protein